MEKEKEKKNLMIVSSWDRTQDLPHEGGKFTHWAMMNIHPHEGGKFTHWAMMNIHPSSYKKSLFNMVESRVVTHMVIT